MTAITCGSFYQELPTSWEEAGPIAWELLRDLARHPPGEGKLKALRRLCQLTSSDFARFTPDDVAALAAGTEWLDVGTALDVPIKQMMRCRWRVYHWPGYQFVDGQALAYAYADEYYEEAIQGDAKGSAEATRNLLATLARPMRGLERQPIVSRADIEARGERFRKMPPEWYAQALMYWTGVKLAIHKTYGDYLFTKDDSGPPSTAPTFSWFTWFRDIATEGAFGDLAAVHRADFHDICQHLVTREGRRRDQERAMETARNQHK
jgi:hypothetical protein